MTAMNQLYGRYHGRILGLVRQSTSDGAWKAKLREILAEFDDDRRLLSASGGRLLQEGGPHHWQNQRNQLIGRV